ncbi:MAG: hypothetical protein PHH00_00855 [Candidatus Nanoarchaeia archaeon]|nr:hypothetical protein [Candidatus Nanoarchaeia archaeon]
MNKRGRDRSFSPCNFFPKNRRGQITIFIILGLIVVGAAVLVYFLYPQIKSTFFGTTDPSGFIQTCMEDKIKETVQKISLQGGSVSPGLSFPYYNEELNKLYHVEYLCYTNKYQQPCVMQQPLLQGHMINEIKTEIGPIAAECFRQLKESYERRGYSANLIEGSTVVDILPDRVVVTFNKEFTITKGESQRYEQFSVLVNNNLYELSAIANSILNWESNPDYGDAPTQIYMANYHNLIVEKKEQTDGTKVYILTDLNTNDIFQFATRSFAAPGGYGWTG